MTITAELDLKISSKRNPRNTRYDFTVQADVDLNEVNIKLPHSNRHNIDAYHNGKHITDCVSHNGTGITIAVTNGSWMVIVHDPIGG